MGSMRKLLRLRIYFLFLRLDEWCLGYSSWIGIDLMGCCGLEQYQPVLSLGLGESVINLSLRCFVVLVFWRE